MLKYQGIGIHEPFKQKEGCVEKKIIVIDSSHIQPHRK